jgi:hypothetical protein
MPVVLGTLPFEILHQRGIGGRRQNRQTQTRVGLRQAKLAICTSERGWNFKREVPSSSGDILSSRRSPHDGSIETTRIDR